MVILIQVGGLGIVSFTTIIAVLLGTRVGLNGAAATQKLVGDVNTEQVAPLVSAYTPVPGGVGSVTTATGAPSRGTW